MREIKFRAWCADPTNKDYVPQMIYQKGEYSNGLPILEEFKHIPSLNLMQYTGLKDKNGKEVYEGDILNITSSNSAGYILPDKYEVTYGAGGFDISRESYGELIRHNLGEKPNGNNEVIGNKFENPELLSKEEEIK